MTSLLINHTDYLQYLVIFTKLHNVHHASRSSISVCNNKSMYYVLEIIKFLSYIIELYLILYHISSFITLLQYIGMILMFKEIIS